jgi:hypothetical protein
MRYQPVEQRRCQPTSRTDTGKDQAVDEAPLAKRHPLRHELVGRRIDDCLACA